MHAASKPLFSARVLQHSASNISCFLTRTWAEHLQHLHIHVISRQPPDVPRRPPILDMCTCIPRIPSFLVMYLHSLSCTFIPCHVPSFLVMYLHSLSCTSIPCHVPSFLVMYLHSLSCTFIPCHVPCQKAPAVPLLPYLCTSVSFMILQSP
jgi:hypothetical protein